MQTEVEGGSKKNHLKKGREQENHQKRKNKKCRKTEKVLKKEASEEAGSRKFLGLRLRTGPHLPY